MRIVNKSDLPVMVMLVGLSGSGKSTLAQQINIASSTSRTTIVRSSDSLREEMFGDINDQTHNSEVFDELHRRIKDDLRNGKNSIYDATNLSKKRRKAFLESLNKIECYKICVCVMTPYDECLERNQNRERKVPNDVIKKMYCSWTPPYKTEGFDEVRPYITGNIKDYNINKFMTKIRNYNQGNKHHSLSLGEHMAKAGQYICSKYDDYRLNLAALLHDCGKPFTMTKTNFKGEEDGDCHYYNHENCGAYDSLFYLYETYYINLDDAMYISNLIYYHMHPYIAWEQSENARNKAKIELGEMFNDIYKLHEADVAAH